MFYTYGGVTVPHRKLMLVNITPDAQVKDAGGISTFDEVVLIMSLAIARIVIFSTVRLRLRGRPSGGIGQSLVEVSQV